MQKRLTAAVVEKLKPDPNKRLEIIDMLTPGLPLRISPSGKKSWSYMYKVAGEAADSKAGKNNRISIGPFPLISLATALEKASEFRDLADKGIDPKAEKQAQVKERVSSRTKALIDRFISHKAETTVNWKNTRALWGYQAHLFAPRDNPLIFFDFIQ